VLSPSGPYSESMSDQAERLLYYALVGATATPSRAHRAGLVGGVGTRKRLASMASR
jgi:hypothetical protein